MIRAQRSPSRLAFTLVELLVVLAIISILAALITAGVMAMIKKGPQTVTVNEMSQLDLAIQNFKSQYKVDYIPSRIRICERIEGYSRNDAFQMDSLNYLLRLWPQLTAPGGPWARLNSAGVPYDPTVPDFIDWNGNGKADGDVILEGDQCLVFFLGGIPIQGTPAGVGGFSTDPRDPSRLVVLAAWPRYLPQTTGRKGPFFEGFSADRLIQRTPTIALGYYSFLDPHSGGRTKSPYAYFSNYGVRNGYNKYGSTDCWTLFYTPPQPPANPVPIPIQPYYESTTPSPRYYNPATHQIISAGADGKFGPGGLWLPNGQYNTGLWVAPNGRPEVDAVDDQTNFYGNLLGN